MLMLRFVSIIPIKKYKIIIRLYVNGLEPMHIDIENSTAC